MNHMVDTCPLTKVKGGLQSLHNVDDDSCSGWNHSYHNTHMNENFPSGRGVSQAYISSPGWWSGVAIVHWS